MRRDAASSSVGLGILLLGTGAAWNGGNVGAVVAEISAAFDISLGAVGLIAGTVLFGLAIGGALVAPAVSLRLGMVHALFAGAVLCALGNVVFALADDVAVLVAGRVIAGLGFGIVTVLGPVFAASTGGVKRVGLFGASIQLGVAGGLLVGGLLADAGVEWRVGFWISALVPLVGVPLLLGVPAPATPRRERSTFLRLAARSSQAWRLLLVFIAIFTVPMTLGAWLVHYLTVDNGIAVGVAGVLGFVLFAVSGAMRMVGGELEARGLPIWRLATVPLLAAGIGLVAFGLQAGLFVTTLAVLACGIGFAIPYSVSIIEAERLYPARPAIPVAWMTLLANAGIVAVVPAIGPLLDEGLGDETFIGLGLFVLVAALLNTRAGEGPLPGAPPAPTDD